VLWLTIGNLKFWGVYMETAITILLGSVVSYAYYVHSAFKAPSTSLVFLLPPTVLILLFALSPLIYHSANKFTAAPTSSVSCVRDDYTRPPPPPDDVEKVCHKEEVADIWDVDISELSRSRARFLGLID